MKSPKAARTLDFSELAKQASSFGCPRTIKVLQPPSTRTPTHFGLGSDLPTAWLDRMRRARDSTLRIGPGFFP